MFGLVTEGGLVPGGCWPIAAAVAATAAALDSVVLLVASDFLMGTAGTAALAGEDVNNSSTSSLPIKSGGLSHTEDFVEGL